VTLNTLRSEKISSWMPFYNEILMIRDKNQPSWTAGFFVVVDQEQEKNCD
jgi:hypothetical protein